MAFGTQSPGRLARRIQALIAGGSQPTDADLTALAALPSEAGKAAYATGVGQWALTALTAFGRSLWAAANAAAGRALLELGTAATSNTGDFDAAGDAAAAQAAAEAASLPKVEPRSVFRTAVSSFTGSSMILISGTAYWLYVGYTLAPVTIKRVRFRIPATGGSGAQTAEIALASSPLAPNNAAQVLTKIAASGALDDLTSAVVQLKANSADLNAVVPAGTHLWVGLRTAMASTQPTLSTIARRPDSGEFSATAAAGALTGPGPWTATPTGEGATWHPEIYATTF